MDEHDMYMINLKYHCSKVSQVTKWIALPIYRCITWKLVREGMKVHLPILLPGT